MQSQDKASIILTEISLITMMNNEDNLQPTRVLPKLIFSPFNFNLKDLIVASCKKIQSRFNFSETIIICYIIAMSSKSDLQLLRVIPKPIFSPLKLPSTH